MVSEVSQCVIGRLATMILSALEKEISRDALHSSPHYPTLRRLSRCLVAILYQSMQESDIEFVQNLCLKSTCFAWHALKTADDCNPDLFTLLHGNALELIRTKKCTTGSTNESNQQRLLLLANGFSNQICHWRVRLSAANALLQLTQDFEIPNVMFGKFHFLQAWLELMQDEDCDVRKAAISVSNHLYASTPSCYVTELAFINDMQQTVISAPSQEMLYSLLGVLCRLCEKAFHDVDATIDELYESNRIDPFATIFNVGTSRLIFESDTTNSYHERCFVCQLIAVSTTQIHGRLQVILEGGPVLAAAHEFLKHTKLMLSRMMELIFADSSLHDITHSYVTFPLLHNQIIGTLAYTCILGHEQLMIQEIKVIASMLVNATISASMARKMNPLIENALLALALDCPQSKETVITSLHKCCFLLPQTHGDESFVSDRKNLEML
jgi:hypothetical protein